MRKLKTGCGSDRHADRRAVGDDPWTGSRPVRADDGQGRADHARRKALFQSDFSRSCARSGFSHLARFALGRRLPRGLAAGHVLQSARSLSRDQLRTAARSAQDPSRVRSRRDGRILARDVPAADAIRRAGHVRRAAGDRSRADRGRGIARAGRRYSASQSDRAVDAAGRHAQSPRLHRRMAGARAERHAHQRLLRRQVRRLLPGDEAAAEQGAGRRGGDPARHRQAARDRRAADRRGVYGRRQPDRPHSAGRDIVREAAATRGSTPSCNCVWSTSSSRISGCPSGDRQSLQ